MKEKSEDNVIDKRHKPVIMSVLCYVRDDFLELMKACRLSGAIAVEFMW